MANNLGSIDQSELEGLGNSSTSLSMDQIKSIKPADLFNALHILSTVQGWDQAQSNTIIQTLVSSGLIQVAALNPDVRFDVLRISVVTIFSSS